MMEILFNNLVFISWLVFFFIGFYSYVGTKLVACWIEPLPRSGYDTMAVTHMILVWPYYACQDGWSRMICFAGGDKKNIKECLQHLGIKDKMSTMKSKQLPIKQEDIEENALITSPSKRGILSWRN